MWKLARLLSGLFKPRTHKKILLLSCRMHGSHYYECMTLLEQSSLKVGELLVLQREPKNAYDEFAIEVYNQKGIKLGYIPKQLNQAVSTLMDQGCKVDASIDKILTTAWEPITLKVYCYKGL